MIFARKLFQTRELRFFPKPLKNTDLPPPLVPIWQKQKGSYENLDSKAKSRRWKEACLLGEMTEARTCPGPDPAATPPEPDERDWEEIVHLLEFVDRSALRKMTKPQLVQAILDLLAITSQLQLEKEKRFK